METCRQLHAESCRQRLGAETCRQPVLVLKLVDSFLVLKHVYAVDKFQCLDAETCRHGPF